MYVLMDSGDRLEIGKDVQVQITGERKEKFHVYVQTPKNCTVRQTKESDQSDSPTETPQAKAKELVASIPLDDICQDKPLLNEFLSELFLALANTTSRAERHRRQAEGIAAAKARGIHFGKKGPPLPDDFDEIRRAWRNREFNILHAAELCGMPKSTFWKAVQRAEEADRKRGETEHVETTAERTADAIRHHQSASLSLTGASGTL